MMMTMMMKNVGLYMLRYQRHQTILDIIWIYFLQLPYEIFRVLKEAGFCSQLFLHVLHNAYRFGCMCMCVWHVLSHVGLFETPWTVAHQAPLSMGFLRQEYWSGLPFQSQGGLSDPEIEPESSEPPVLAGKFFITLPLGSAQIWLGSIN